MKRWLLPLGLILAVIVTAWAMVHAPTCPDGSPIRIGGWLVRGCR